jgi:hypothetical protein
MSISCSLTFHPERTVQIFGDRIKALDLPGNRALTEIAHRLQSAMKSDKIRDVRSACNAFLAIASNFYGVPDLWRSGTSRETSTKSRAWHI